MNAKIKSMKVCISCKYTFTCSTWKCPNCQFEPKRINGIINFETEKLSNRESFNPEYFEELFKLEPNNFWFRTRNNLITLTLKKYFSKAKNFLEIGCGTGFVLTGIRGKFPDMVLSGSEIFIEGLVFAEKRLPGVSLYQMDARRIPFESEFDVIGAFDVLEHIENDYTVLAQMHRATNPGGGIIITVPQHPFLWSVFDEYSNHKRRYYRNELIDKVESAGFKVLYISSFITLLFPLMLLSRLKFKFRNKKRIPKYTSYDFINIFHPLNILFEKVCDIESIILRCGISYPFGGSLICVAAKE